MQASDIINSSLLYIEQNLKANITLEELADISGYSTWHYCRLFNQAAGMSVARYICKRRIDCALAEISAGHKAVDVVLEYGFDTYAGFYKAVIRIYGCSPKRYLSLEKKYEHKRERGLVMITEPTLRKALTNWDIPQGLPIRGVYFMDGDVLSDSNWILGDKYTLRTGKRDRLLKDLRVEKALASVGFTAGPVSTKDGCEFLEGERIFTLTHRPFGEPLAKDRRFGENCRQYAFKYGQSIAKLHNALAAVEADIMPDEKNLYKIVVDWAMPETKRQNEMYQMGLPKDFFEDYTRSFAPLFANLPKQLIHRNPCPPFILFDGEEISGFSGYDLCERNVRLFDLCYCATGILAEQKDVTDIYKKWPQILEGILRGYDSATPLTEAEKQAVLYVTFSIQMIFIAYCEPQDELKELAKVNREMLCYIVENYSDLRFI